GSCRPSPARPGPAPRRAQPAPIDQRGAAGAPDWRADRIIRRPMRSSIDRLPKRRRVRTTRAPALSRRFASQTFTPPEPQVLLRASPYDEKMPYSALIKERVRAFVNAGCGIKQGFSD